MFNFADTGGLFDHYEVNREPFWPKMSWLVAGSGAWHLVLLVLILAIPPVRDAFSITAMFRDAGFVDHPYTRTEIEDADILDFSTEKFHYPEGYWAMDQQGLPPLPEFPVAPFTPTHYSASTSTASPSPSVTPGASPTPLPLIANSNPGKTGAGKNGESNPKPSVSPEDKSVEQAQKDLEAAAKKAGLDLPEEGQINKAPFKDLADYANTKKKEGKLDFNQSFEIEIESVLDNKGQLVGAHVTKKSGDDTLIDLGKRFIESLNESGVLAYLQLVSKDKPNPKVVFTISQDGSNVSATIAAETSSPDSAQHLTRTFAGLMLAGRLSRKGKDEEILLQKTGVSADGNSVVFKLAMQHDEVVDIVSRGMAQPSPTVTP